MRAADVQYQHIVDVYPDVVVALELEDHVLPVDLAVGGHIEVDPHSHAEPQVSNAVSEILRTGVTRAVYGFARPIDPCEAVFVRLLVDPVKGEEVAVFDEVRRTCKVTGLDQRVIHQKPPFVLVKIRRLLTAGVGVIPVLVHMEQAAIAVNLKPHALVVRFVTILRRSVGPHIIVVTQGIGVILRLTQNQRVSVIPEQILQAVWLAIVYYLRITVCAQTPAHCRGSV